MSAHLLAALCASLAALFDVEAIPVENASASAFPVLVEQGHDAGLAVLDGANLEIHSPLFRSGSCRIPLEEGTSAFDVADIDGDGRSEVLAICGTRFLAYSLPGEGPSAARTLFEAETLLGDDHAGPLPYVLAVPVENGTALALPTPNAMEIRSPDGTILHTLPLAPRGPGNASYGAPFRSWAIEPPEAGKADALEVRLNVVREFQATPPEGLQGLFPPEGPEQEAGELSFRRGTPTQMREAGDLEPASWPWFPLRTRRDGTERALYALTGPGSQNTTIRIREAREGVQDPGVKVGPGRKYPGTLLVLPGSLPDFNGDGYTDLLLWSAPEPGRSFDALSRALVGGDWPLRLRAHIFSPLKNRYEPACAGLVTFRAPLSWFLVTETGAPVRNCVLNDFNGDGKSDLACSVTPKRFSVWLYDDGFAEKPDFSREFSEPVSAVALEADLAGKGRASLVLRGDTKLFFLRTKEK